MGEIKSTLEIALEKAKAVEISNEERERFKKEEVLAKARDIFSRFKSHPSRTTRLAQEIKRSGGDVPLLKACLTEIFLEALDVAHSSERIWQGLQELGLKDPVPFKESLARIAEDEGKARREETEKVENTLRESLAESGISGTAVDPNIEENAHWRDFLTDLDARVSEDLKMLRQRIFRAIEAGSSSSR